MGFRPFDDPEYKPFIRWSRPEIFMSVSQFTRVQLVVFFSFSILVVLLDNPGISKCLNT